MYKSIFVIVCDLIFPIYLNSRGLVNENNSEHIDFLNNSQFIVAKVITKVMF